MTLFIIIMMMMMMMMMTIMVMMMMYLMAKTIVLQAQLNVRRKHAKPGGASTPTAL